MGPWPEGGVVVAARVKVMVGFKDWRRVWTVSLRR